MPTLLKQGNYYYSQFYNSDKKPQRKRIALKTTYKSVAYWRGKAFKRAC